MPVMMAPSAAMGWFVKITADLSSNTSLRLDNYLSMAWNSALTPAPAVLSRRMGR
ncbi:MAG: hypothetical protein LBP65_04165 [Puniceicoccales bacterium]|nr:hypothetical protein [Puniceicoccales bacterium]